MESPSHHAVLPVEEGGTNATGKLVFIKNDPDHTSSRVQIGHAQGMSADQPGKLKWPMPDPQVRASPQTPGGAAY